MPNALSRSRCPQGCESKCHICEEISCGGDDSSAKCDYQIQGVSWNGISKNIPSASDSPWAVNGNHR
jgi:hypothetical protein